MSAEKAFNDLDAETESAFSYNDPVQDSTGTLSNERLQDLKREWRDEVVASLKADNEERDKNFSMLSTMYVKILTELEQTKARCSELEKKVETMDLKSRESDEKIETSLILVEKFSKDHEDYKNFYQKTTMRMNELTAKIIINAQENRLTDAERTEMEEKHMLQLSMRANMLPASKSTRDVYLLMKALRSGVEFANIKLSRSFSHEMDISANNWWFRMQGHPGLLVSDHDYYGWSHFGWNWEFAIGYPAPHFPYKTALIHTTSFKSSKQKKRQYLHKTLHPKDYDGYDIDHGDHLVRYFRWNSVTDAVDTEQGRKELRRPLIDNQIWLTYENGGDPKSFGTEFGQRIMANSHLEHDLILCFWKTKDPVVRSRE